MTILLVEDDAVLADGLIQGLSHSGYRATQAATVAQRRIVAADPVF
ncbi:MAG: hypothetical protein LUQ57_01145 [Methylococcaceae bacterium]|nr:hypothetical protein [Methylococcaceae bacterium]